MPSTTHLPFSRTESASSPPPADSTSFTLSPTPNTPTDIWRKPGPPLIKTFNAPLIYKSIPLSTFQCVRVTITGNWTRLYDQGGLIFLLHDPEKEDVDSQWVKTGVEFYHGEAWVGTVGCDRWADWSLTQAGIQGGGSVTVEMERDGVDDTLWVYVVDGKGRTPVREVTWVLGNGEGEKEVWVGVYAASPKPDGGVLEVGFEGWELVVRE